MMETQLPSPAGKLISQTIAMPRETNANGDIFGGWLLSQMDLKVMADSGVYKPTSRVIGSRVKIIAKSRRHKGWRLVKEILHTHRHQRFA